MLSEKAMRNPEIIGAEFSFSCPNCAAKPVCIAVETQIRKSKSALPRTPDPAMELALL
jgi:hypothetical protein